MKALALVLLLSTPAFALDGNPLHPGLPPCLGGETGYWQTVTVKDARGKSVTHLAITAVDFLDPATVVCWVDSPQLITADRLKPQTPIKAPQRTIGTLRHLYAQKDTD